MHGEPRVVDLDEHAAADRVGGALAPAFDGLRGVPGRARRDPAAERDAGDGCRVRGATGEHQVGAGGERFGDRLVPHQPDDVLAAVDGLGRERAGGLERCDATAVERIGDGLAGELAVDLRHREGETLFFGDLQGDVGHPVDAGVGAGGAARRDDHGDAGAPAGDEEHAQVALERSA